MWAIVNRIEVSFAAKPMTFQYIVLVRHFDLALELCLYEMAPIACIL